MANQWETDPKLLPPGIIARLPVRFNYDDRYFTDTYEWIPKDGYTKIFERMLGHPLICLQFRVDCFDVRELISDRSLLVYTGPIDRYFGFHHGQLGWRTINLEKELVRTGDFQGTSVMNYADEAVRFTRIHEFRHLHPERNYQCESSVLCREYSRFARANDEPYYPIATGPDELAYARYKADTQGLGRVVFGGRLGTYHYLDMRQAIGAALVSFERDVKRRLG